MAVNLADRLRWRESFAAVLVLVVLGLGGGIIIARAYINPVVTGLLFTALSGIAGHAGWAVAVMVGSKRVSAFGIRRVRARWLLIGAAGG